MAIQASIDNEILRNTSMKMLQEFKKDKFNPLMRVIIKKYIKGDCAIEKEKVDERYNYSPAETVRKNIYIKDEVINEFDKRLAKNISFTSRKRTSALEVCLLNWLDGEFEITEEELFNEVK